MKILLIGKYHTAEAESNGVSKAGVPAPPEPEWGEPPQHEGSALGFVLETRVVRTAFSERPGFWFFCW